MTRSEAEGLLDPFGLEKNGVKKAFRKAALYWHPDKGGDAEMFAKMVEARGVLLGEKEQGFEYMKPEGPFVDPFQSPFENFWNFQAEQRRRRERNEHMWREAQKERAEEATIAAEGRAKTLRAYGVKGTIHFVINGQKFDIFL